jgi:hypothetical protein
MKEVIMRRSNIEPEFGHIKMDEKLSRNLLKGSLFVVLYEVMCGAR